MEHSRGFNNLLRRAQAGDRQAQEGVLAIIRPWLNQVVRGYADPRRPEESASDLGQEVWLRAWQKIDRFQGGADDEQTLAMFHAWVGQIAKRTGLNARRDRKALRRNPPGQLQRLDVAPSSTASQPGGGVDPPASGQTPSAQAAGQEQIERVRFALDRLADETDRAIVRLRFFEGLSLRQIAEQLHINPEKVRVRYHAILKRLERDLED